MEENFHVQISWLGLAVDKLLNCLKQKLQLCVMIYIQYIRNMFEEFRLFVKDIHYTV